MKINSNISDCVIIGSSRGLGAALVQEILDKTSCRVYGISRTSLEQIPDGPAWSATGRYDHLALDISSEDASERMAQIGSRSTNPLCVIYNAAHIEKDINKDRTINYNAFDSVNRVGINGLGNVLFAFEHHLLKYGGIFIGISSLWGSVPPLYLPYLAYPASKAYLNMVIRCLRVAWREHVKVVAVNIGNIKEDGDVKLPKWFIPTYSMAAKKIVTSVIRKSPPKVINYPLWHSFLYRYAIMPMPEFLYSWIFNSYLRLESSRRKK